jgi:hypothetical protein
MISTFDGLSGKHLQEYLGEFYYHFNRRFIEKIIPTIVKFSNH